MHEDRQRPPPPTPDRQGVEGGEHDVSTDQQPPSTEAPPTEPAPEGEGRGEGHRGDDRPGGMAGEGF